MGLLVVFEEVSCIIDYSSLKSCTFTKNLHTMCLIDTHILVCQLTLLGVIQNTRIFKNFLILIRIVKITKYDFFYELLICNIP